MKIIKIVTFKIKILFLYTLIFTSKININAISTLQKKQIPLIQTISEKGKISIENGGYSKTLSALELIQKVKKYQEYKQSKNEKECKNPIVLGIGLSASFNDMYLINNKASILVLNKKSNIESKSVNINNFFSSSKASILCKDDQIIEKSDIIFDNLESMFEKYLSKEESNKEYIFMIELDSELTNTLALSPTIRGSGKNYPFALPMEIILNGGVVIINNNSYKDIIYTYPCPESSIKKCINENNKISSFLKKSNNEAIIINKPISKTNKNQSITAVAVVRKISDKKFKFNIISNSGRIVDAKNIKVKTILFSEISDYLTLMPDSQKCKKNQQKEDKDEIFCDKFGTWHSSKVDLI